MVQLTEAMSVTVNEGSMVELRAYIHLLAGLAKHQHHWITESSSVRVKQLLVSCVMLCSLY